jgi:hypothetical protein
MRSGTATTHAPMAALRVARRREGGPSLHFHARAAQEVIPAPVSRGPPHCNCICSYLARRLRSSARPTRRALQIEVRDATSIERRGSRSCAGPSNPDLHNRASLPTFCPVGRRSRIRRRRTIAHARIGPLFDDSMSHFSRAPRRLTDRVGAVKVARESDTQVISCAAPYLCVGFSRGA